MHKELTKLIAQQILDLWHTQELVRIPDNYFKGVPLYVIMAVYSYETLEFAGEYAISNYSSYFKLDKNSFQNIPNKRDQHSVTESLMLLDPLSIGELNNDVFRNHQPINVINGYAKSKVVVDFLKALQSEGINYIEEIHSISDDFVEKIKHIPDVNHELLVKSFKLITGVDSFSESDNVLLEYFNAFGLGNVSREEMKSLVGQVIDFIGEKEGVYFRHEEVILNIRRQHHCMRCNNYILFKNRPKNWGLRGDPYFWLHLRSYFASFRQAQSVEDVEELFYSAWRKITRNERDVEPHIYIPEIEFGGMSGGYIDVKFWKTEGLEQLKNNFIG